MCRETEVGLHGMARVHIGGNKTRVRHVSNANTQLLVALRTFHDDRIYTNCEA